MPLERGKRRILEVDGLGTDGERPPAEPRKVEEVADQPLEAPRLSLDHDPGRRGLEHAS